MRNKLPRNMKLVKFNSHTQRISDKICIGLFGILRYKRIIEFLLKFIESNSNRYELIIYGKPSGDISYQRLEELGRKPNIHWMGSYNYPDQLEMIYNKININFVVYDNRYENVRMAIPNKLYESILFNRPR